MSQKKHKRLRQQVRDLPDFMHPLFGTPRQERRARAVVAAKAARRAPKTPAEAPNESTIGTDVSKPRSRSDIGIAEAEGK